MSQSSAFNAAAAEIIKSRGLLSTYTQSETTSDPFYILIDRDVEIVDPDSGACAYVTAAIFAKSDFPFDIPKPGDTILQSSRSWVSQRQIEDDGYLITLEVI
jgi:hypothetical protein